MPAFEVRWTEEAEDTFDTIILFIKAGWGDAAADKFINEVNRMLNVLQKQPLAFPESSIAGVRKTVIIRQSSLFYEVQHQQIILLFFWDNRQNPLLY